jgi:hypothetical protein
MDELHVFVFQVNSLEVKSSVPIRVLISEKASMEKQRMIKKEVPQLLLLHSLVDILDTLSRVCLLLSFEYKDKIFKGRYI